LWAKSSYEHMSNSEWLRWYCYWNKINYMTSTVTFNVKNKGKQIISKLLCPQLHHYFATKGAQGEPWLN
jgi:hypothetical protein